MCNSQVIVRQPNESSMTNQLFQKVIYWYYYYHHYYYYYYYYYVNCLYSHSDPKEILIILLLAKILFWCNVKEALTCHLKYEDPLVCIPATYFIGESGLPLEVVGGSLPVDQFVTKAEKVFEVL